MQGGERIQQCLPWRCGSKLMTQFGCSVCHLARDPCRFHAAAGCRVPCCSLPPLLAPLLASSLLTHLRASVVYQSLLGCPHLGQAARLARCAAETLRIPSSLHFIAPQLCHGRDVSMSVHSSCRAAGGKPTASRRIVFTSSSALALHDSYCGSHDTAALYAWW
jgi:hypothetical protein